MPVGNAIGTVFGISVGDAVGINISDAVSNISVSIGNPLGVTVGNFVGNSIGNAVVNAAVVNAVGKDTGIFLGNVIVPVGDEVVVRIGNDCVSVSASYGGLTRFNLPVTESSSVAVVTDGVAELGSRPPLSNNRPACSSTGRAEPTPMGGDLPSTRIRTKTPIREY